MIVWKIYRIPGRREDADRGDNYQYMHQILYSLQNLCFTNFSLEMSFVHETGVEISLYLFLRGAFNNTIVSVIEMQLTAANYQFERLGDPSVSTISQQLIDIACRELHAVVKTEKIVTTPFMREQYYYWADALLMDESREPDNFTMLFQALQKCDNSFVSFQLMPTSMQDYEANVLQYLNMHLEPHVRNSLPNAYGMSMYEPYAQPAYNAYRHYMDKRGQPVYQYNIAVGSMSGNSGFIANQVISTIKAQTSNAPELQAIPVQLNRHAFRAETFPSYLSSVLQQQYRDRFIWGGNIIAPQQLFRFPYLVTADEAILFFRLPYDDGKIVGVRGTALTSSNELLDSAVTNPGNIVFGKSANDDKISIGAPEKLLSQHALIVGMPGTGKTTFCLNLLLQFHKKGIPFLAIEPTKAEYRALIDKIPELQIFTPGNNSVCPFVMNPFIPPRGVPIERYKSSLFSAFRAAFSMPDPLDVIFQEAIGVAYNRYGWRDYNVTGDPGTIPFGFHEFIMVFKQVVARSEYSKEVKGNLRSGGTFRLSNLIEKNRNIFDTIHTIPIEDIMSRPTVIELNAIEDAEQKALIISILLINMVAYTKATQQNDEESEKLCNAVLLDEAHVLLDPQTSGSENKIGSQNFAVKLVENLIAEIRSYSTGIIVADQRPSAVGGGVRANTDIKIAFRLTEKYERELISGSMDDNMQQQLSGLEKGQAFVFYHKLKKTQLVITPDIRKEERIRVKVPDKEIQKRSSYWNDKQHLLKPYAQCTHCNCGNGCNFRLRADAVYFCDLLWDRKQKEIVDAQILWKYTYGIPALLKSSLEKYAISERMVLVKCISIALQRKAAIQKGIILDEQKLKKALLCNLDEVSNNVF